jgi:hypothetical protein
MNNDLASIFTLKIIILGFDLFKPAENSLSNLHSPISIHWLRDCLFIPLKYCSRSRFTIQITKARRVCTKTIISIQPSVLHLFIHFTNIYWIPNQACLLISLTFIELLLCPPWQNLLIYLLPLRTWHEIYFCEHHVCDWLIFLSK